eukprot:12886965-Prorocentrum_lima.AAC.1
MLPSFRRMVRSPSATVLRFPLVSPTHLESQRWASDNLEAHAINSSATVGARGAEIKLGGDDGFGSPWR